MIENVRLESLTYVRKHAAPRGGPMTPLDNHKTTDFLLTAEDVAQILQISPRTVWRWLKVGRLPTPLRYSKKCVRWRASDIQQHLAGLKSAGTG